MKVKKETTFTLKGSDPYKQKLTFVAVASKGQLVDTIKNDEKIYIPTEAGADELRIYAINALNVVSQAFVEKVEVEE